MPAVIIHTSTNIKTDKCSAMLEEIREAMIATLEIKADDGQVILYQSPIALRCIHSSRDSNFILVQIIMLTGRNDEMKETLFKTLNQIIYRHTAVNERDIIFNIMETAKNNWAYNGGMPLTKMNY